MLVLPSPVDLVGARQLGFGKTGSPYVDEVGAGGWDLDEEGMLAISNVPGLGLELDHDAVVRYSGGACKVAELLEVSLGLIEAARIRHTVYVQ